MTDSIFPGMVACERCGFNVAPRDICGRCGKINQDEMDEIDQAEMDAQDARVAANPLNNDARVKPQD